MPTNKSMRHYAAGIIKGILPQALGIAAIFFLNMFFFMLFSEHALPIFCKNLPSFAQPIISTVFSALVSIFITMPLTLGIMRFFWQTTLGADNSVAVVFYYFSGHNYSRALSYSFGMFLRMNLFMLLGTLFNTFRDYIRIENVPQEIVTLVLTLLMFGSMIFGIYMALKFFLTPYLLINDENLDTATAFETSKRLMFGQKGNLFGFMMSFFPWLLLCLTILPMIYVYPFYMLACAIFAKYIIQAHNLTAPSTAPF